MTVSYPTLAKGRFIRHTLTEAKNFYDMRKLVMVDHPTIPHFQNNAGHAVIEIGVKEFKCVGATPPFDHPHIYLDLGTDTEVVCPYCSTLFRYNPTFSASQTKPEDVIYRPQAA